MAAEVRGIKVECPECKRGMAWQEGLLGGSGDRDTTKGRYYCSRCRISMGSQESREIKKGRELAPELVGVHAMSKKVTSHSCATQIGILRARQHCTTCGKPSLPERSKADYCHCKKCTCLYCAEYKRGIL